MLTPKINPLYYKSLYKPLSINTNPPKPKINVPDITEKLEGFVPRPPVKQYLDNGIGSKIDVYA